jgi:phage tail sheath gpL-like
MPDVLNKLQPDRTMYLRGFDHLGAGAAMHNARPDGFEVTGIFRDPSDFAVLVVWDADDFFNHPTLKYLPDTNFAGLTLQFDATYQNLMPLNCTKYATIDWPYLDMQFNDGTSKQVSLSEYAQTIANPDPVASGTFEIVGPNLQIGDRLIIWYLNLSFDYTVPDATHATLQFYIDTPHATYTVSIGGSTFSYTLTDKDTAATLVQSLVAAINAGSGATGVTAAAGSAAGEVDLTLVNDPGSGVAVSGTGNGVTNLYIPTASTVASNLANQINSVDYEAVKAPFGLQATASGTKLTITTTRGGYDANFVRLLAVNETDTLKTSQPLLQLSGGDSTATLRVSYDFLANLGAAQAGEIRKMWLTFAPRLADAQDFVSQEWNASFDNWTVTGPDAVRQLQVPGPSSYWIEATDDACQYAGDWSLVDGFYLGGLGNTGETGAQVTVKYTSAYQHDVWLATELNASGGTVTAVLDGGAATTSAVTTGAGDAVTVRKLLFPQLPPGFHSVTLTVASGTLLLDHFIVSVPTTDTPALPVQTNLSAALDYSTDHTYKLPPARILWLFNKLGLAGPVNQYIGVFWWNQRQAVGGQASVANVTFAGSFFDNDQIFLSIGGQVCGKTVRPADTPQIIAQHFANFINAIYVGVWAEADDVVLRIHCRSSDPAYRYSLQAWTGSAGSTGTVTADASLGAALVQLSGNFTAGDQISLNAGGQICTVTVTATDTLATIAQALASAVNSNSSVSTILAALTASSSDATVTIENATPDPSNSCSLSVAVNLAQGSAGAATLYGTLQIGALGTWQVDPSQDPPLNAGARAWHTDFYTSCAAAGLEVTTSCSMELVNPPDGFAALFADGLGVTTDVGFADLFSTQCAFSSSMQAYHTRVYTWLAQTMAAAGLSPVLQCGEFTWWYFAHPAPYAEFPFYASGNGNSHFIEVDGVTYTHVENNPQGESSADVANALAAAVNAGPDPHVGASIGSAPYIVRLTPSAASSAPILLSSDNGSTSLLYTGGMAYYDAETAAAAQAALRRPLAAFLTPNDDPTLNASADATFLRNRLRDYCGSITSAVKAAVPGTQFEILFPYDVNYPVPAGMHNLGGRLNRFVNLPAEWSQPGGSGFDRFKLEELDFGAWTKDLNLVWLCQQLPASLGWPMNHVSCITPVFRPGYAWMKEVSSAYEQNYHAVTLWAFDHVNLFGLDLLAPGGKMSMFIG